MGTTVLDVRQFSIFAAICQVVFIVLFGVFGEYDIEAHKAKKVDNGNSSKGYTAKLDRYYPSNRLHPSR